MSLFEWIGESVNPGPTGSVDFEPGARPQRTRGAVLFRFVLALVLVGVAWGIVFSLAGAGLATFAYCLVITFAYATIGYLVRPRADRSNLGWAGGLMDDPFRYSDDINRSLLFLAILLAPGRFVGGAFLEAFRLLWS